MESKKIKMTFGLQDHHIERINKARADWNQPDKDIPGTPHDAILIEGFWDMLGREFGWAPFTLALHYMRHERRVDNNTGYRSLWDYLHFNHGLQLLESDIDDLVHFVHKFHPNETIKVLEYDNNRLKGEVEGLRSAVEDLQTKYDNILATESGHESKTENVWQSGFAAGHEAGSEKRITAAAQRIADKLMVIVRKQLGADESAAGREDAVMFAEWALREGWETSHDRKGWMKHSNETPYVLTTAELYELFKQQKEK